MDVGLRMVVLSFCGGSLRDKEPIDVPSDRFFLRYFFVFLSRGVLFWILFIIWHAGFLLGYLDIRGHLKSDRFRLVALVLMLVCVSGIILLNQGDALSVVVEPLQRLGNRAHITMMLMSLILTIIIAVALRAKIGGRWFVDASNYSYTLYLVHFPLLLFAYSIFHPLLHGLGVVASGAAALFSLVLVVAVSAYWAKLFENRELSAALFDRLIRR